MSLCKILAVSGGYLAKFTYACMALYHSSMLKFPWWKLVSKSNLARTFDCGLQYSSYFPHMASKVSSVEGKFQDTYCSILQSPLQAITFLHFWHSGSTASLHSKIFFAFKVPLEKSVVQIVIYYPIHAWTFNIGHVHASHCWQLSCWIWRHLQNMVGWKDTSWSSSCSELGNSSLESITSSSDWDGDLDLCAELWGLWAILGLCTW